MGMQIVHLDPKSVADAVDAAISQNSATRTAVKVTNPVTTGVQNPANAAYNQADQTALAAAVLSIAAKVTAIELALTNAGLMSAT